MSDGHGTEQRRERDIDKLIRTMSQDITDIKRSTIVNTLKLWGVADPEEQESEQGRIPRIEHKIALDQKRLTRLERFSVLLIGGGTLLGWLWGTGLLKFGGK